VVWTQLISDVDSVSERHTHRLKASTYVLHRAGTVHHKKSTGPRLEPPGWLQKILERQKGPTEPRPRAFASCRRRPSAAGCVRFRPGQLLPCISAAVGAARCKRRGNARARAPPHGHSPVPAGQAIAVGVGTHPRAARRASSGCPGSGWDVNEGTTRHDSGRMTATARGPCGTAVSYYNPIPTG
jgi:hypothetical protein